MNMLLAYGVPGFSHRKLITKVFLNGKWYKQDSTEYYLYAPSNIWR